MTVNYKEMFLWNWPKGQHEFSPKIIFTNQIALNALIHVYRVKIVSFSFQLAFKSLAAVRHTYINNFEQICTGLSKV